MKYIYRNILPGFTLFIIAFALFQWNSQISYSSGPRSQRISERKLHDRKSRKLALLIGVSGYARTKSDGNDWSNLNTQIDVNALEQVLVNTSGQFRFDEVKVLKTPEQTTRNEILGTFASFLINQTQKGDIVYFHYSGHGSQVEDDNKNGRNPKIGDEIDGFDETLVPSDYISRIDGSNDIRDDEIEELIAKLLEKSPASVTMSFDSCHSGTITRAGDSIIRGGGSKEGQGYSYGENESPSGLLTRQNGSYKMGLVLISAARHDQSASENPAGGGAFSNSLIRALRQADDKTTYRQLFEQVTDQLSCEFPFQSPQMEGEIDQKLMSGIVEPSERSIEVDFGTSRAVKDAPILTLKAGLLMGVSQNSEYAIYESGKDTKTTPIAAAIVSKVGNLTSVLRLKTALNKNLEEKLRKAKAIETKHNFGDIRLTVFPHNVTDKIILAELAKLSLKNLLKMGDPGNYDVRICRNACPNELNSTEKPSDGFLTLQRRSGGSIIARIPDGPDQLAAVTDSLNGEARWRFFNNLQNERAADLKFKIRLIPVKVVETVNRCVTKKEDIASEISLSEGGQIIFHEGDTVMVEVMNLNDEDIYLTLLDVTNNGIVTPLFPSARCGIGRSGENRFSNKKDSNNNPIWQRIPIPMVIKITKPFGAEVFRAIATRIQTDFSPLFSRESIDEIRGGGREGQNEAQMPLGQLFTSVIFNEAFTTRDAGRVYEAKPVNNVELNTDGWGMVSIPFEVRKKL